MNFYFFHSNYYFPPTWFHKNEYKEGQEVHGRIKAAHYYEVRMCPFCRFNKGETEQQVTKVHKLYSYEKGSEYKQMQEIGKEMEEVTWGKEER